MKKLSPIVVAAVLDLQRTLVDRQREHARFLAEVAARPLPKITAANGDVPPPSRASGESLSKAHLALDLLLLADV